ncbi:DNA repair protein complementing XP-A cells [Elysia marginata]|uniref:DNA repair protein complementing XP-A cells n=1 Tax=Elysia marginata TaxID=1093978 RepID=A0AAV4J6P7_9GAST|nr:DNA repair protein complementing XP-A cells [Elysia marginata]
MDSKELSPSKLTPAQRERIERNKKRAELLRKSRVTKRTHEKDKERNLEANVQRTAVEIDTGAGFFLEDSVGEVRSSTKDARIDPPKIVHEPGPVIEVDNLLCEECEKEFLDSYLYKTFSFPVCDRCRDEEKHSLITKTDAKNEFLLKDEDFDKREPELEFILRKNPHNPRWGDMKLFLRLQVYKRAMEVWGSEAKLQEAKEERIDNREKAKQKKFNKKLKELRMSVRSSLWRKNLSGHQHEFGDEEYDEDEDMYSKTCCTCGHIWSYEKM